MNLGEPILAFPDLQAWSRPDVDDQSASLGRCLSDLLRRKLGAAGRRLASATETERIIGRVDMDRLSDRRERDRFAAGLGLIPADHLILGRLAFLVADDDSERLEVEVTVIGSEDSEVIEAAGPSSELRALVTKLSHEILRRTPARKDQEASEAAADAIPVSASFSAFAALALLERCLRAGDEQQISETLGMARAMDEDSGEPLRLVAQHALEQGHVDLGLSLMRQEIDVLSAAGREFEKAEATLRLAHTLIENGDWEQAGEIYEAAQARFEALGDERRVAQARSNVASVLLKRGAIDEAIAEYREALLGAPELSEERAQLLYNLGLAEKDAGHPEEALKVLDEALGIAKISRRARLICRIYNARGTLMDALERLEEALQQYRFAEEYYVEGDNPSLLAGIKDHMALSYRKLERLKEADSYSKQACDLFSNNADELHQALAFINRASLLIELGRYQEARRLGLEACEILSRVESPHFAIARKLVQSLDDAPEDEDGGEAP